jgi:hypothetical protein
MGVLSQSRSGLVFERGFAQAVVVFDGALKLYPRLADTYCRRGAAWLALDKLAEAEADFTRRRTLGGTPKTDAEKLRR